MPAREDELGGLWLKTSAAGKKFMSGKINGQEVVVFRNEYKKPGERSPDWRVYRSQPREGSSPPPAHDEWAARKAALGQETKASGYDYLDDEIPF